MKKKKGILEPASVARLRKLVIGLCFAGLITPFLLSSQFFFPFISTKTFFFRFLVEILLAGYAVLALARPEYRPTRRPLTVIVLLYLVVHYITSLAGFNWDRSFWGNVERGEGLLTFTHVIAYFFVLAHVLRTEKQWRQYFAASVGVSVLVGLYAVLQKAGVHSVGFMDIFPGDVSRLSGTIGNAAFFAGYQLIHVFLAAWLVLTTKVKWQQVLVGLVIIFQLWLIIASQTRGALLGLFLGVLIFASGTLLTTNHRKIKKAAAIGLVVIVLAGGTIWIFRGSEFVSKVGAFQRLATISRTDVTTESRLLTWQASWEGWKDRFFLGYGYENYNIAFNKYFPAKIFRDSGSQIWFDRAHNTVFDVAISSGVFGLLCYLGIFAVAFMMLFRNYRRRRDDPHSGMTSALFGGLLAAYFFQNLFVFDTLGTYITFYAVLAYLIFITHKQRPTDEHNNTKINAYAAIIALALAVLIAVPTVFRPARATMFVTRALYEQARGDLGKTQEMYEKAISMNTYVSEEARQKFGEAMISLRDSESASAEAKQRAFRSAIDELTKAVEKAPHDSRNYMFLMAVYNNSTQTTTGSREEVIRLGEKVLELSPTRPQVYFEMGQAAVTLGRNEEGIGYFEKAYEINTEPTETRWNLGLAHILVGDPDKGLGFVREIASKQEIGKISDGSVRNLVKILSNRGLYDDAILLFGVLIARNPESPELYAERAALYGLACNIDAVEKDVDEAVSLNPELAAERENFLQQVRQRCSR